MKKILLLISISINLYNSQHQLIQENEISIAFEEKPLFLVIGSIRQKDKDLPYFLKRLWGEDEADLTHDKTFDGNAITIDLQPSRGNGNHIITNATNRKFPKNSIAAIYIERFPTIAKSGDEISYSLSQCINNIAPSMKQNATIVIEWFSSASCCSRNIRDLECSIEDLSSDTFFDNKEFLKDNPFYAFINRPLLYITLHNLTKLHRKNFSIQLDQFIEYLKKNPESKDVSPEIKKSFLTCCEERSLFEFGNKIEEKDLTKNILLSYVCLARYSEMLTPTMVNLLDFYKNQKILGKVDIRKTIFSDLTKAKKTFTQPNLFKNHMENSIVILFLHDTAIIYLTPYVESFMRKQGFHNITIERKQSTCNNRKNVWLIEAKKE